MDRLDYSKGIPGRLQAFDKFLEKYPEYQGRVSLFLIVVPSRDHGSKLQSTKRKSRIFSGAL